MTLKRGNICLEADFLYCSFQNSNFNYRGYPTSSLLHCVFSALRKQESALGCSEKENDIFSCHQNSTISDNSHLFSVLQKTWSSVKALGGSAPSPPPITPATSTAAQTQQERGTRTENLEVGKSEEKFRSCALVGSQQSSTQTSCTPHQEVSLQAHPGVLQIIFSPNELVCLWSHTCV